MVVALIWKITDLTMMSEHVCVAVVLCWYGAGNVGFYLWVPSSFVVPLFLFTFIPFLLSCTSVRLSVSSLVGLVSLFDSFSSSTPHHRHRPTPPISPTLRTHGPTCVHHVSLLCTTCACACVCTRCPLGEAEDKIHVAISIATTHCDMELRRRCYHPGENDYKRKV